MKPINQLMMNLEIAINELCDFAIVKRNESKNALETFDMQDIIEECHWMTYHKCEIRKILDKGSDKKPF